MPAPLTITTASLSNGYVGSAYAAILAASGGNGTRSWVVTWGTLPDGLSLDPSTGVVSGTPTSSGTSDFTVQASDIAASATKSLAITIKIHRGINWWLIGGTIGVVQQLVELLPFSFDEEPEKPKVATTDRSDPAAEEVHRVDSCRFP